MDTRILITSGDRSLLTLVHELHDLFAVIATTRIYATQIGIVQPQERKGDIRVQIWIDRNAYNGEAMYNRLRRALTDSHFNLIETMSNNLITVRI